MTSILKIHLKDGRVIAGRAEFGKGSPANPMTFEEAAAKFRGCAEYADWPSVKTEKIIAFVRALDSAPDVSALSAAAGSRKRKRINSAHMKTFNIAVIAGDGIGKEVCPKACSRWKRRDGALDSRCTGTPSIGVAKPT